MALVIPGNGPSYIKNDRTGEKTPIKNYVPPQEEKPQKYTRGNPLRLESDNNTLNDGTENHNWIT